METLTVGVTENMVVKMMGFVELNDYGQMPRCMRQFRPLLPWAFLPLFESRIFSLGWSSVSAIHDASTIGQLLIDPSQERWIAVPME